MCSSLLKSVRLNVSFVSSKDERDLEPTAESLVEEQTRLERGNEWKPGQECDGHEYYQTHPSIIHPGKFTHRVPQA